MADVMEAMKKGKVAEDIPMLQILQQDAEQRNVDFNALYQMLSKDIKAGKTRIMRSGNTLLIYDILQPGVVELHISTMDSPDKLVKSVTDLFEAMKVAGFKKGMSVTDNPQIARVLSAAKIPAKVKQMPSTTGVPQYQLTIEVQ